MVKKILLKIYSFWIYLFKGLNQADKIAFGSKNEALDGGIKHEQHEEQDSVWNDLLKGELTQRVIDLRYETAHADRESKNYEHVGGGVARKKNKTFTYSGKIENSDDLSIYLVQQNKEEVSTISDCGEKVVRTFRFKVGYDFIAKFRLDAYIKKLVVRIKDEKTYIADFYITKYHEKSNNEHKFFLSEINKIVNGYRRSDLLDISTLTFDSFNAFGADDGITFNFDNFRFIDILEYDGSYILRFTCKLKNCEDFIDSIYNKESERKFKEKVQRETYTPNLSTVIEITEKKEDDDTNFEKLTEILNTNGGEN